jgi:hypothetical protein
MFHTLILSSNEKTAIVLSMLPERSCQLDILVPGGLRPDAA